MIIIGITGTLGAGKGTIVEYLMHKYQFAHFSVRNYLTDILKQKNTPVNRDTMTELANGLRKEHHSPSFIIEELYRLAVLSNQNCIIESIRTVGEVQKLREIGNFFLLAIDADKKIRYERIHQRNSETDTIDFDTFVANENREMENSDEHKQNIKGCIELADYVLTNNGGLPELHDQIDHIIKKILHHE
jgi:dephospho-CoA kinase